jgi:ceramide glucosyltransferase
MMVLAVLATVITAIQVLLVMRFRGGRASRPPGGLEARPPHVSILKPVCGLDDELEENLTSFAELDCEVILSAEEADDPALEVARRVMDAHPAAQFRIVVDAGSRTGVVNRKVERLIAAARVAKGDILLISDSNVRVERNDLARTLAAFNDPRVGLVSNLFIGSGAKTLGATIESLHILGFVVPGAVIASAANLTCVVGKSMAITRGALDAIGGFERFRRVLAEDQAIGLAVKAAGYGVVLSPQTVRNVIVRRTLHRALDRQIRWNKIRYSFSHRMYCCELLTNPLLFTLFAPKLLLVVLAARYLQFALLNRTMRTGMSWRQLVAVPLLDLMMAYAWFIPFFSSSITWRGYRARLGHDTELIQIAA